MTKTSINFILDCFLLVLFLLLIWVSVIVRFIFPPGVASSGYSLWGLEYAEWIGLQFVVLAIMTGAVLLHVMLHWNWVCGVISSRMARRQGKSKSQMDDGNRTLLGVGTMIVLLNIMGLGIAAAALMLQTP